MGRRFVGVAEGPETQFHGRKSLFRPAFWLEAGRGSWRDRPTEKRPSAVGVMPTGGRSEHIEGAPDTASSCLVQDVSVDHRDRLLRSGGGGVELARNGAPVDGPKAGRRERFPLGVAFALFVGARWELPDDVGVQWGLRPSWR